MKYVRCDGHCKYPAYDKNEIDEQMAKVVLKDDYATITGSITLTANTQDNVTNGVMAQTKFELSYPEGFNKDNSIVLTIGTKASNNDVGYNYGDVSGGSKAMGVTTGALPKRVFLGDVISVDMYNFATSEKSYDYKIVLMKIA